MKGREVMCYKARFIVVFVCQIGSGEAGDYETRYWSHSPRDGTPVKFGSFYVGPKSALKGGKLQVPMIIWLHGGPHSVFQDRFMPEVLYFLAMGYAVLTVNYRYNCTVCKPANF